MADKRISQLIERTDILNNDVLPIVASGATTTNKVTISTIQEWMQDNLDVGVTSIGITIGSTGTDVNVSGSPITTSGNITINIPTASATARGVVTTGTQTFAGNKTLTRNIDVNGVMVGRGASGGDAFSGIAGNTAVGSSALLSITTGFPNTTLGSEALRNITTGSNNIGIGSEAGKLDSGSGAANATSSSSIYIGNNTRPQTNGNTNEIVIGHASTGNGSNSVTIGNSSTTFNKLFGATQSDSFRLPSDGGGNQVTVFENIGTIHTGSAGSNIFGFNNSNNIFFGKGLSNGGVIQWTNAAVRYYTLQDADGTIAFTSDITSALTGYVTIGTAQTITGSKTFNSKIIGQDATLTSSGSTNTLEVFHTSGSGHAVEIQKAGNGEGLRVIKTSGSGNAVTITGGLLSAEAGTFSGDLQSSSRLIAATGGQQIIITPNLGAGSNRIESTGSLPLALVSAQAITLAAGGTTPQITLASTGAVTLTGALNGTSASFNTTNAITLTASDSRIRGGDTTGRLLLANSGTTTYGIFHGSSHATNPNAIQFYNDNTLSLTISSTGAATFSSSVTATQLFINGNGNQVILTSADANGQYINFATNGGSYGFIGNAYHLISSPSNINTDLAIRANTNLIFSSGGATERMRITSGGNVGIGTATPDSRLSVFGTFRNYLSSGAGGQTLISAILGVSNGYLINVDTSNNITHTWHTGANATSMHITSGGDLYIGSSTITAANTGWYFGKSAGLVTQVFAYSSGTAVIQEFYRQSGSQIGSISYNGTATLYNSTSDYRLKEDLQDYNGLEIVSKLKTYDFNWKDADTRDYGMIAHELQEVLPNYVSGEKDAVDVDGNVKPQGVDYSKIVPILIKSIQEQQEQIKSLTEQVEALKSQING